MGDFSTPRAMGDWDPEVAAGLAAQEILANSDIPVTEGGDPAQSRTLPVRHGGRIPGFRLLRPWTGDRLYPERRALPTDCRV